MNIEQLSDKFGPNWAEPHKLTEAERAKLREDIEPVWNQYANLPLTISVDDESIRRLCQVLTNNGYETFSSCEGHGREKPYISFGCRKTSRVAELTRAITQTTISNFLWQIDVGYREGGRNRYKIYYRLRPEQPRRENLDVVKDQKHLIEDFDILGYSILDHFLNK